MDLTVRSQITSLLLGLAFANPCMARAIPNFARADLVLGQPDFVSSKNRHPNASGLDGPSAVVVDPISGKVFVADDGFYRVLRYPTASSLKNGGPAEAVFGQPGFGVSEYGSGPRRMKAVGSLFLDRKGRLWVPDGYNNRVLCFDHAVERESGAYPDRVFGQANFSDSSSGTTASKMHYPSTVCVDDADRMWVADFFNHRILRFDEISGKPNGAAADGVLGQSDFITGKKYHMVTADRLRNPEALCVSSKGALFVTDSGNNRILRFDHAATLPNGADASGVIGQPDFTTSDWDVSMVNLYDPRGVSITPDDTLWVNDSGNYRVLRFRHASTRSGSLAADLVIGQPDFHTRGQICSKRRLQYPWGNPFVDSDGSLWVGDFGANRVLRFPVDSTKPLVALTKVVRTGGNHIRIKGTASDAYGIKAVFVQVGTGSFLPASGSTEWQADIVIESGPSTIRLYAVDRAGNKSRPVTIRLKIQSGMEAIIGEMRITGE